MSLADRGALLTDLTPGPESLRPLVIAGADVTLRPPVAADAEALFSGSHDEPELVWTYMGYGPWPDLEAFSRWVSTRAESRDPLWFSVVANSSGAAIGMATMLNYDAAHRRVELGHIWYVPAAQRTTANTESTYLLLRHAFFDYRARRVEWKCDARNQRSRLAAIRLGFEFEGIFRHHMIVKGRNRDTAWYSVIDRDWPDLSTRLEEWLYQTERDESGRPRRSLVQIGMGDQPID